MYACAMTSRYNFLFVANNFCVITCSYVSYLHAEQLPYCDIFKKYYNKLASIIQVDHLVDYFVSECIISVKERESVTVVLLLQMIASQLKNGTNNSFIKLLDIMQQFGNLEMENLARSIKSELNVEFTTLSIAQDTTIDFTIYDDADLMFTVLVSGLHNILSEVNFQQLHTGCISSNKTLYAKYPSGFIKEIDATGTLDQLISVLKNSSYCNWMNVELLERTAVASLQPNAYQLVQKYKEAVSAKKLKDVFSQLSDIQTTEDYYSKVKEKWDKEFDDVTIKDVIGHWNNLEKIFDVEKPGLLLGHVFKGSVVEFCWLIPSELVCHAQYSAFKNWCQLDDILYLDICDHVIKNCQFEFTNKNSIKGISHS